MHHAPHVAAGRRIEMQPAAGIAASGDLLEATAEGGAFTGFERFD